MSLASRFRYRNLTLKSKALAILSSQFNYAVGGTPGAAAHTGHTGNARRTGAANRGDLGSASTISQVSTSKLRVWAAPSYSITNYASVPAVPSAWAGAFCVLPQIGGSGAGGFTLPVLVPILSSGSIVLPLVYPQIFHQGRVGVAGAATRAVCIIIASNRSISVAWASTRACRASTRADWSLTGNTVLPVISTSIIQRPSCIRAASAFDLMRLRTVSADIPRCAAASFIDSSMPLTVGQPPMRFACAAYAGLGQFGGRKVLPFMALNVILSAVPVAIQTLPWCYCASWCEDQDHPEGI